MKASRNSGIGLLFVAGALLGSCGAPKTDDTLASLSQAFGGPTVSSVTLSPSTIAGGSGGGSTGTVSLTAAAPSGGLVVTLTSSNTSLAATVPSITVPAGATSGTFAIGTNARYRRYSGLSFSVSFTGSANGGSASATLSVSAQPRPGNISNDTSDRFGTVCGGSFPASQGEAGILYNCSTSGNPSVNGTCTFQAECFQFGCQSAQSSNFKFSDACAGSGPFPLAISPNYAVSGAHPTATFSLAQAATAGSGVGGQSNNFIATVFPTGGVSVPVGATSASQTVATSIIPSVDFVGVSGKVLIAVPGSGGGTFDSQRIGLAWLALAPPTPAPSRVIPTLGQFVLDNPVPLKGGTSFNAEVWASGVSPAGGPTITLMSSNAAVASIPPSVTIPVNSNVVDVTVQHRQLEHHQYGHPERLRRDLHVQRPGDGAGRLLHPDDVRGARLQLRHDRRRLRQHPQLRHLPRSAAMHPPHQPRVPAAHLSAAERRLRHDWRRLRQYSPMRHLSRRPDMHQQ